MAFRNLGHEIVGACEIDKYARQVYARHFPGIRIWEDATKIQPEELPDFDILCGGFPCQAFSLAGRRLGFEDTRGTLFYEIARIAKQKRPRYLFLENVRGLLYHDEGRTLTTIIQVFYELGYDIEWQVINSKYFVPQNRERIFIIGHLGEQPSRQIFPIGEIGELDAGPCRTPQKKGQRIRGELVGAIDANYSKGGGSRTMIEQPKIQYHIRSDSQANRVYELDGIAPTLGTGHAMQRPNINQDRRIRSLTPLECERLQGFPDGYTDGLSDAQRYKCLGNAVTVPVIEFIAKEFSN